MKNKHIEGLAPLPTEDDYARSQVRMRDSYYKRPQIIECFLQRTYAELPYGYYCVPWSLNRAVTLFGPDGAVRIIPYENIEDNIVWVLDSVGNSVREHQNYLNAQGA